jgi:hypothetical protein
LKPANTSGLFCGQKSNKYYNILNHK